MLLPLAVTTSSVSDKIPADAWLIAVMVLVLFIVAFVVRKAVKMMMILLLIAIAGAVFAAYRFGVFG
ncbi:MAG: hypothetical protein QOK14_623 [Frankiaceae bacterium]|nr:hypothetical protein [Frankiaceae bacterium]